MYASNAVDVAKKSGGNHGAWTTNTAAASVLLACLKHESLIWSLAHSLSFLNRKPD